MTTRTVQTGLSFEYLMWIFTRISGLAIFLLAAIGMISAFILGARTQVDLPTLMRWTFFPNPNHVINSNIPDVTLGWANGLRVVVEDFVGQSFVRPFLRGFIFFLWVFAMIIAIYVILFS